MSITRRILFGAAASWFSRGVSIVLGLVLLPVLFRTLPKEELGIWLLLGQSWATMGILDLGFGVTITRRIALAKGRSGSDTASLLNKDTTIEIADLVATAVRIYRGLALLSFAISFGLGFYYLRALSIDEVSLTTIWTAWGVLCLSQAFSLWATPWTCLLQGIGYVGWDAILSSFISALTLIGQIITVLCGGGLVCLSIVAAVGVLVQRTCILGFARRKRPEMFQLQGRWRGNLFREFIPFASRAWLTAVGGVCLFHTDQFFIAGFSDVGEIPAYRSAFVIAVNLFSLASVFASASSVFVSHLWSAGEISHIHEVVVRNTRVGMLILSCGTGTILALGPRLFDVWLGAGNFIGYPIVTLFLVIYLFEQHSWVLAIATRATDNEAFAVCAVAGGSAKLLLAFFLVPHYGLLGLAGSTFIAQMATSNWFITYRGLSRLRIRLMPHLISSVLPGLLPGVITASATCCISSTLLGLSDVLIVIISSISSGVVLIAGIWYLALDHAQKNRVIGSLSKIAARLNVGARLP
jgi:O-antigen/teichoic acid export membrane protein